MKNLFILLLGLILVSCSGDGGGGVTPKTSIELKAGEVSVTNTVNSTIVAEFTASAAWTIEGTLPAWLDVSPKNGGAGNARITITVKEINPSTTDRTAYITVKCGTATKTITVTQKENTLTLDKSTISIIPSNLIQSFTVTSNVDWSITGLDGQNWCSVYPMQGTAGATQVTVYTSKNPDQSERSLTLQIASGSIVQQVKISQPCVYEDGTYMLYQNNSKGDKPIYLVFMGDGYTMEDHFPNGDFDKHLDEGIEALFSIEPYKTYREYFKVYKVAAYSQERGMSGAGWGSHNTRFKTTLANANSTSLSCLYDLVFDYALRIPEITALPDLTVALVVNADQYAGTCYMWENGLSLSMIPVSRHYVENYTFTSTLIHEVGGHGFGQLGDEYFYDTSTISPETTATFKEREKVDWFKNLDVTGSRDAVKWKSFLTEPGYSVDMFQGGYYHAYGVWRPEQNSCMNNNIRYYNAPSREAIVQRIMKLSRGTYNRTSFITNDKQKTMPATMQSLSRIFDQTPFIPLPPPIIMD